MLRRHAFIDTIAGAVSRAIPVLRLKRFDTATDQGRSLERYRRIALTALSAFGIKGLSAAANLAAVSLSVRYLGTERYGLWMTISSAVSLFAFADLGLGSGLVNVLARADGLDDRELARRHVSSAFFLLLIVAASLALVFGLIYSHVSWPTIYNVSSAGAMREAGPATAVLAACSLIGLPIGVVQRVHVGHQEGFLNNAWLSIGSIVALGGVVIATRLNANLPWLVTAMIGMPVVVQSVNFAHQFTRARPWLAPSWSRFEWPATRDTARVGAVFFLLSVFMAFGTTSDNVLIARALGPEAVARYSVVQRLFVAAMLTQFVTAALWPAFGESIARHDYAWAVRTLRKLVSLSAAFALVGALALVLLSKQIIRLWVGPELVPSTSLLLGMAFWFFVTTMTGALSSFMNSGVLLRAQVLIFGIASLLALIAKLYAVKTGDEASVAWAGASAYAVFHLVPSLLVTRRMIRRLDDQSNPPSGSRIGCVS